MARSSQTAPHRPPRLQIRAPSTALDAGLMQDIAYHDVMRRLCSGQIDPHAAVHALRNAYRQADRHARGRSINDEETTHA